MTTARTVACAAALAAILALVPTSVTAQTATCALNPTYNYSDVFPYNWVPPTSTVFVCPTEGGWVSRGPNCFKFYSTALSWSDASTACMSKGAVLAEIDLFSNNLFVGNLVTTTAPTVTGYWIGLTRTGSSSTYDGFWSDGASADLVVGNWAAGQPTGASGTCAWVANNAANQYPWALDACNVKRPFVCETKACIIGQFLCFNGNCVNGQYVCDGANDCGDMSDEMNCPALCTQTVPGSASSGTIQSANYPSAYPASSNCLWLLQGPLGANMQLTFTAFTTEANIDVVDIYVGGSTLVTSQYAGSISGTQSAASLPTYVSNNHLMIVRFTADSTVQKTGFQANWKTTFTCNMGSLPGYGYPADQNPTSLPSTTEANCQTTCLANANCASFTYVIATTTCNLHSQVWPPIKATAYNYWVKTCPGTAGTSEMQGLPGVGSVLSATSTVRGVFSPGYPLPYFTNLRVFWVIQASTVWSLVTIQAMDVSLGPGDSVEVHDGATSVGVTLQRYIGDGSTNVKYITTTQQFMYIYMSTVSSQRGRGFYFNYFIGCTYTITATSGTIQSPGYGVTNYPPLANCMWKISIPTPLANTGVTLAFTSTFNVGSLDKLTIYTDAGRSFDVRTNAAVTGFNGQTAPANIYAASGIILVTFTSDANGGAPGFFATFSQDCPVPKLDNNTLATPSPIPLTYLSQFSATCNIGYHFLQEEFGQCPVALVGASVTVICQAGGAWSGLRLPTCTLVQCGAPPVIENGLILNVTSLYYGGIAYYGCQGGFVFGDLTNTQATCLENGVWTTPSVCQGIQCPAFNIPANGAVNVLYGDGLSFTSVLQVVCNTGYELTAGFPVAFCRSDQTWSYTVQPVCSILSCVVPTVTNGVVTSNGGTVTTVQYGTPVQVTCNSGYQLLGSATVTCNELGQFPDLPSCLNINECLNSPCTGGGTCFDTQGSFYCMCAPGYVLDSSLVNCVDIDECATNNGYCDNNCQNTPGSFSCSCTDPGAILYSANGTSGVNIVGGETGLDNWNVLRLNRSCVPIACPIPTIQFGSTVSDAAPLLYSAAGTMLLAICNIGYVLGDGSQDTSLELMCQSDGTWNPPPPTCINATCPALVLPSTLVNPPTNISPQTPVNYNRAVTWQCNVPGRQPQTFTGTQTCLYDVNNGIYNLTGSSPDCGVIDCGFPAGVAGMDTSSLTGMPTVFNSTFTFQCLQGFTLNGTSPTGDLTVRCVADPRARWDYGSLVCVGPVCTDPGTPPDGFQNAQTYEAGKVVTFGCNRQGFAPNPPSVTCTQAADLTMQWSPAIPADGPKCVDVTPPTFPSCTANGVAAFVNLYDPVSTVMPMVTDNSRLVASLTTTMDLASPITASQIITWTATDAAGNSATCNSNVTVRVQVAPSITCPASGYVYLTSGVGVITQAINVTTAIPYGTATITRNIVVPPSVTIGVAQLWQTQQFTQIATDNFGNQATCNFQLVVAPGQCSSFALKTPGNGGSKICTNATANYGRCAVSCPSGLVLYNLRNPSYFVCSDSSPVYALETDPTVTYVPDCIPTNSSTYQQNYQVYYTTGSTAPFQVTTPYLTVIQGLLNGVQSTLQGLCNAQLASPPTVLINQTLIADTAINYLRVTYSIKIVSASQTAGVTQCGQLVLNAFTDLANAQLTYTGAAALKSITMPASSGLPNIFVFVTGSANPSTSSVQILLNNYSCSVGLGLQSDNGLYYCVSCAPGMQKVGEFCTPCPVGTYQNLQGQTSCNACPNGTSTYAIGSSAASQCVALCAPGFTSTTGLPPCTQCPTSSFWSSPTSCTACPAGTSTTSPGAYTFNPNVTLCMSPCAPGFYSPTGLMPCTACPIGYYQNVQGQTTCVQCQLGSTTSAVGAIDSSACTSASCSSNPCQNGGTCNVNAGSSSLTCSCPAWFTGIYCQTYIDPCASRPCYHNGTCASNSSLPGTYTCTCPPVTQNNYTETPNSFVSTTQPVVGYQQSASLSTLDCQRLCSNNALCAYAVYSFQSLACYLYASAGATVVTSNVPSSTFTRIIFVASIYSGSRCEISPNNCATSQCQNQANCQNVQLAGAYNCLCLQNSPLGLFNGTLCDKPLDVCASNPCQNKGTCVKLNSIRYKCTCAPGYTGYNCQTNINECSSNPCLYGGTCTDLVNAFNCACPLGYSGPTCATRPASICAVYNQPCGSNGRCVDYYPASSYLCACNTGYTSELYWSAWLSIQSNVTSFGDTETLAMFRNMSIAVCPEDPTGPMSARFRVKGTQTVFYGQNDAPQVLQEADSQGLVCANSDQQPGTLCFTYEVQFQCNAKGLKCYFENDCSVNPCQNGGSCTPQVGGYSCKCVPGYNGVNCQHLIDYCQSNPCMYGGVCTTDINKYVCNCQPGFGGNNCQTIPNNCLSNACNATGTAACNSSLTGYTCQCKPGYTGIYCDTIIDNCFSFPCHHGGTCTNLINSFKCTCPTGYTGATCANLTTTLCQANTCANGGLCVDGVSDYLCRCNANFYGRTCNQGQGVCQVANPCLNGGSCTNTLRGATCSCSQNYGNPANCECQRNFCSPTNNICQNGATCSILPSGSFQCACPPGYTGATCASMINNCVGVNCGSGTCINGILTYYCACPVGFVGDACSKAISRNVDICLSSSNGVSSLYPYLLNVNSFSIGFWVLYSNLNGQGEVITVYSTASQSSVVPVKPLLVFNATTVVVATSDGLNQYLTYAQPINDGVWHYVTFTFSTAGGQSQAIVYVDTNTNAQATSPYFGNAYFAQSNYALIHVGASVSTAPQFFQGCVSLIQVWNTLLTSAQMNTVFSAANSDVTASWYLTGLLWDYGYGLYTAGDHVMAVVPSRRGQRVCPVGQSSVTNSNGQKVCSGPDKSSPYLNVCPDDISSPVTSEGYALVSWTPPTFNGATSVISNFVPDTTFPLGIDPIMYVAKNAALNYNECTFRALASLGTCSGLRAPNGASAPVCSKGVGDGELYTRCTVSCPTGMAFLRPLPNILDCWEAGVWNTYNPYVDLQLPPCGNLGTVRKRIVFGFTYNLKSAFTSTAGTTIQTALQTALSSWNQILTSAGAGVCTDSTCSNTNIIVFNSNGQAGVTITLDQSPLKVGSGVSVKTAVVQATLVDQRFVATTVPGADSVDPTTFNMTDTTQCDANTQPTGDQCIQCPPGTYFNSTAQLCLNCAVGSYQDQPMQAQCISCGTGLTTQKDGSVSSSDCFTSCNPGSYYDFTAQSCLLCPLAQFQTCSGRSFCQRCPSGKTTSSTGASSSANCFNDCPSGYQLMSNGSCAICAVGTYRLQGFQSNCTQCPDGFTTLQSGSIRATDCNTVVCPLGQFRTGANPGTCNPCPIGFYRNASQANCTSCGDPSKWRTSDVGATDYSFCKFYCPAGQYISSTNQCSVCPQSTYKDLSVDDNYYATSCTQCSPPLSVTASTGATSSAACLYPACTAGQVVDTNDNTQCANCPFNTYQPNPVPTTDTCISCPPNTGTPSVGTANLTQCSILCPSGQEVNTTTLKCQPCARAFWKDNTISQAISFSPCQPCPSGTITPSTGATSVSQCTQADCQPGSSINPTDNTQCDPCVVGTYQAMKWQTSCIPCPSGSSTLNTGSMFLSDCSVLIDTTVSLIQFNITSLQFNPNYLVRTSSEFIQLKNQVETMMTNLLKSKIRSFRGTAQVIAFTPGPNLSIIVTAQAQFNNSDPTVDSSLRSTLQVAFSSGQFSDPTGQYPVPLRVSISAYPVRSIGPSNAPTSCLEGQGINFATGGCEPCAVGSYQLSWSMLLCASCQAGYSTLQPKSVGDQTCLRVCAAGSESRDGTTCQKCLPNFYKSVSGPASCTACDSGLITVVSGATSVSQCQAACPSGQYSTGTPPACQPCAQGSYQNVSNQLACIPCPQFYNTAGQGASDVSACLDVCSLDTSYCQNSGKCTFDINTKQASCACSVIFTGDRCGSFSWVLWVIIAAGAVVVVLIVVIVVVCVYRQRKNKGQKDQKKLQQQLQNLQLQNAIKNQQDVLNPQQKSVLKSRPPLMMYDESNLAGVAPQQHVSFYNPTYRNDQGAAMNTLYGMSPGYAPSLSHSSGFLFHEDADDTRLHPTQRTPTSGAFYQAS